MLCLFDQRNGGEAEDAELRLHRCEQRLIGGALRDRLVALQLPAFDVALEHVVQLMQRIDLDLLARHHLAAFPQLAPQRVALGLHLLK